MTHPTWQLNVDAGALVLTPCPGTKDADLDTSLAQLKQQGVAAIVTALDESELASKGVAELGALDLEGTDTEQVDLALPLDVHADLKADAQRLETSMAHVVRWMIAREMGGEA